MRITLCGSTRFRPEFEEWNRRLSLAGHVVYSVACYGHSGDVLTEQEKTLLDKVHKAKIKNSDAIFVLDVNGYIGKSTLSEIQFAMTMGKGNFHLSNSMHCAFLLGCDVEL